jgi:catechol 2,3-dioxygenase-like lactoylglutathione lyase family enzyme
MEIQFISGFAVITPDPATSRKLYLDAIGLPLEGAEGEPTYLHTEGLEGAKHFGVWPLSQAAQACYGTDSWPDELPVPQASVEFEVDAPEAVAPASEELRAAGYEPVHEPRTEPWGQTIARILSPEGVIVGISYAPWHHDG